MLPNTITKLKRHCLVQKLNLTVVLALSVFMSGSPRGPCRNLTDIKGNSWPPWDAGRGRGALALPAQD